MKFLKSWILTIILICILVVSLFVYYNNMILSYSDRNIIDEFYAEFENMTLIVGEDISKGFYDIQLNDGTIILHNDILEYRNYVRSVPLNNGDSLKIEGQAVIRNHQKRERTDDVTESGYYLIEEDLFTLDDELGNTYSVYSESLNCAFSLITFQNFGLIFYSDIYEQYYSNGYAKVVPFTTKDAVLYIKNDNECQLTTSRGLK